jgi:hypothetical protein
MFKSILLAFAAVLVFAWGAVQALTIVLHPLLIALGGMR